MTRIVAGAAVYAQAYGHIRLEPGEQWRYSGPEAHVRRRTVGDTGTGMPEAFNLVVREPHAVGVPHIVAQPAEASGIIQWPFAEPFQTETVLVEGFRQMRVTADPIAARQRGGLFHQVRRDR